MNSPDDTFAWELTFQQADLLLNCLNEARKCESLPMARLAFGFIEALIATTEGAKKVRERAAALRAAKASAPPMSHLPSLSSETAPVPNGQGQHMRDQASPAV